MSPPILRDSDPHKNRYHHTYKHISCHYEILFEAVTLICDNSVSITKEALPTKTLLLGIRFYWRYAHFVVSFIFFCYLYRIIFLLWLLVIPKDLFEIGFQELFFKVSLFFTGTSHNHIQTLSKMLLTKSISYSAEVSSSQWWYHFALSRHRPYWSVLSFALCSIFFSFSRASFRATKSTSTNKLSRSSKLLRAL